MNFIHIGDKENNMTERQKPEIKKPDFEQEAKRLANEFANTETIMEYKDLIFCITTELEIMYEKGFKNGCSKTADEYEEKLR
jgi:hypothetical protein